MTIGIYRLLFSDGSFYVGRSSNIEKRFNTHKCDLKQGKSNKKLIAKYIELGEPTHWELLELCDSSQNSSINEIYWIKQLNAIELGLNVSLGGEDILYGEDNPSSKYSNEQIFKVLEALVSGIQLKEIAKKLNISYSVVSDISAGNNHIWLSDKHPELYQQMLDQRSIRKQNSLNNLANRVEFKPLLETWPNLVSPEGILFTIGTTLSAFAKEHKLNLGNLSSVVNGRRKSCQGWKLSA